MWLVRKEDLDLKLRAPHNAVGTYTQNRCLQIRINLFTLSANSVTCYPSPKTTLGSWSSRAAFFHQPGIILETYKYGKIVLFQAILLLLYFFSGKVTIWGLHLLQTATHGSSCTLGYILFSCTSAAICKATFKMKLYTFILKSGLKRALEKSHKVSIQMTRDI